MKKAALFILLVVVLGLLSFLPIWNWIYGIFEDKGREGNISQLSVKSLRGEYNIYLDGSLLGKIDNQQQNEFVRITPGRHTVRLERISDVVDFYYVLERPVDFLPSTQVEIEWEAGPTLESSSGTIKYFTEIIKPEGAEVYVLTFPQSATVEFDSKKTDAHTFEVLDTNTHTLKVSNGSGFASQSIDVNMKDDSSTKVLTNLKLVIEVYLYKQPFK